MLPFDHQTIIIFCSILSVLLLASGISRCLARRIPEGANSPAIDNLIQRINAWWVMFLLLVGVSCFGLPGLCLLFAFVSLFCLREWIALVPAHKNDRSLLFFCFFGMIPLLYGLLAMGNVDAPLPVMFLAAWLIPLWTALTGITDSYVHRVSQMIWGIILTLVCVCCIPALLLLDIPGYEGENLKLVLFLILVTEMSDVLQYVYGKLMGKHPIAPVLSPNKTREGLIGGGATAVLLGALLHPITPFTWYQATLFALLIVSSGFLGGLCLSAVKRNNGIKDFGALIKGHGGMLDRMDSLCFSAPAFFYLVKFFFAE